MEESESKMKMSKSKLIFVVVLVGSFVANGIMFTSNWALQEHNTELIEINNTLRERVVELEAIVDGQTSSTVADAGGLLLELAPYGKIVSLSAKGIRGIWRWIFGG